MYDWTSLYGGEYPPAAQGETFDQSMQTGWHPQYAQPVQAGVHPQYGQTAGYDRPAQAGVYAQQAQPVQAGPYPQYDQAAGYDRPGQRGPHPRYDQTTGYDRPAQAGWHAQHEQPVQAGAYPQYGQPAQPGLYPQGRVSADERPAAQGQADSPSWIARLTGVPGSDSDGQWRALRVPLGMGGEAVLNASRPRRSGRAGLGELVAQGALGFSQGIGQLDQDQRRMAEQEAAGRAGRAMRNQSALATARIISGAAVPADYELAAYMPDNRRVLQQHGLLP